MRFAEILTIVCRAGFQKKRQCAGLCRDKEGRSNQFRYEQDCLDHDRIELLRRISSNAIVSHLPFADHMHDFDACQDDAGAAKILEAHHRLDDAFDGTVILVG